LLDIQENGECTSSSSDYGSNAHIIARTVLRELLQNAADASATKVSIKFETTPSPRVPVPSTTDSSSMLKHTAVNHTLHRLVVTNNGQPFGTSDWTRLKRIAEGNPDETKIGAFGVGFYSVFADCEEPFVSSGKEAMAFYWKGNSLFTRRLQLPEGQGGSDTSFVLDYRSKTSPIPDLLSLCQFLATSLTFVGLETIELHLDDWKVLTLTKKAAPSTNLVIPRDIETKTKDGVFRLQAVERQSVQIDAEYLSIVGWKPQSLNFSSVASVFGGNERSSNSGPSIRNFFSRLTAKESDHKIERPQDLEERSTKRPAGEDLAAVNTTTVFLRISTAQISSSVSASFSHELERATKKPPPKNTKLAILTSSYDEMIATSAGASNGESKDADIFASVLPTRNGKIFIGFPTHQTTGVLAHIAAHSVIPTVERESIDLNARWVRTWNVEMLRVAGIVCRITWSSEMNDIQRKILSHAKGLTGGKIGPESVAKFLPTATHVFHQFTFKESTPSSEVASIIEEAFWTCNKRASIEVFSSRGVLPSHEVRVSSEDLSFVEGVPILPEELEDNAKDFIRKLQDFGLITTVTTNDIKNSLEAHALDEKQLGDFLKWAGRKGLSGDIDNKVLARLLDVAVASIPPTDPNKQTAIIALAQYRTFVMATRIPTDMPMPFDTIPFKYTKILNKPELEALGWEELQIVPWVRYLLGADGQPRLDEAQDMTKSSAFASQVLPVISKQWDGLSQSSKATVAYLLGEHTVIPTKSGMKIPREAYFPSVKVFPDLPIVIGLNGVKEKVLVALGVRKTVELGVVFERLMAADSTSADKTEQQGKWSHVDLIKYLSSVRDDIPGEDIRRLKVTPICPAEEDGKGSKKLYKPSELFEPKDSLRSLNLPVLSWPGVYRFGSYEGRFLATLGLRSIPSVDELVSIMAKTKETGDIALREKTLIYLVQNHQSNGYSSVNASAIETAFLPLEQPHIKSLARPSNCFTNERAAILGYQILRKDLHPHAQKFGVQIDPPIKDCIERLVRAPPRDKQQAQELFEYFAGRLASISQSQTERLSTADIVPIAYKVSKNGHINEKRSSITVRYTSPKSCFLGDSSTYGNIFDFVDFGSAANTFLFKCGSKHEPTKLEIASLLVREPGRLLKEFNSAERYLELLRTLAEFSATLKRDKLLWKEMKRAPFLLACKEIPIEAGGKKSKAAKDDSEELDGQDAGIKEYSLARADQIIIVDDFISYSLFKDRLFAAPQEEGLESFYQSIGARVLSELVEEDPKIGVVADDQKPAKVLEKLVYERSRLFLHDYPSDAARYSTSWLEKNLGVRTVRSISLRRILKRQGLQHTEKRSAAVTQDRGQGWTLWITSQGYDMFQVSQALVNLLLLRPKAYSTMIFETLLSTDLLRLRSRGYNVDRILRAKQAEARIAEQQRQKQIEEDRKQIEEQERQWASVEKSKPSRQSGQNLKIPGAFGSDSPEDDARLPSYSEDEARARDADSSGPQTLFSSFAKRFGVNENGQASQQLKDLFGGSKSNLQKTLQSNGGPKELLPPPDQAGPPTSSTSQGPRQPDSVTAPHQLQQTLLSAVQAARSHDSNSLYTRPGTAAIKEQSSYCDARPGQDISFIAESPVGIKIFLSNTLTKKSAFLAANNTGLSIFSAILLQCAEVYAVARSTLHIFYDESGSTIAFNSQGSLFCNYRFFEQLHLKAIEEDGGADKRAEALVYWFVVLAHELAHNLVGDHSAEHSYYT
jgi:hypothetical protein